MKRLLSGNEAVARAAWEAGCALGSGYPGTPSTEIMEAFARYPDVYAEWAPNEKVALDSAIGAAYAGRRALCTMKHVGVNVAADSLFYAAMTGIQAGLVLVSADDPAMHSSQNEQDNRQYARFTRIPCLDPVDSQDAHDLTLAAFELSERFDTPVLLRMTTRICHTSAVVEFGDQRRAAGEPGKFPRDLAKYCMLPANARRRHPQIEARVAALAEYAETSPLNRVEWRSRELGIITGGVAYNYAREVFPNASVLRLGMVYPLPQHLIAEFATHVARLIVLEELDPFIEEQVRLLGVRLYRPTGAAYPNTKTIFPITGELDPATVRRSAAAAGLIPETPWGGGLRLPASALEVNTHTSPPEPRPRMDLPERPPVLCPGCPHRGAFYVLHKLGLPVNGDIGCYTLGITAPLSAMHTVGCMGAGIGVAHGAAAAGDGERHVAVIGDSTFFHTGIPALLNVAYNGSQVLTVIMDNRITGMTGHQDNPGSGETLQGKPAREADLEALVRACGIENVVCLPAYDVAGIEKMIKGWLKSDGPAVLITREPCALLPAARKHWLALEVNAAQCNGCTLCFRVGCPAISKSEAHDARTGRPLARIDPTLCTGCEICAQLCPRDAILFRDQIAARGPEPHHA